MTGRHPRSRPRDLPRAQVPVPAAQGGRARRATSWCPIGKARVAREGTDVSIITYAAMLQVALEAAEAAARDGIDVEVLDLRTLLPLDEEAILAHRGARPARCIVLHEATRTGGPGRRDRGPHRRARLRVPRRAGRAGRPARHAGALLAAARGVLPARTPRRWARRSGRSPTTDDE